MTTTLPEINTLIRVAVGDEGLLLPSRIEDVGVEEILISAPSYVGDLQEPQPGEIIAVYWTHSRGVCSLPAQFVEVERAPIKLWRLKSAGTMELVQRRRYTRVQAAGAVSLVDNDVDVVRVGWMVDLGEGGVRCRLAPGSFSSERPVECRLSLDGQVVIVPGMVLRSEPGPDGVEEVIVTFDEDHKACETVRKYVFAQQIIARRLAASNR